MFSVENGKIAGNWGSLFNKNVIQPFAGAEDIIKRYNAAIDQGSISNKVFNEIIEDSDETLGGYLKTLDNNGRASLNDYTKSLNTSKLSTIGLTAATTLLNMALSLGISLLVSWAFTAISNYIHAQEKARDAAIEAGEALKDEMQTLEDQRKKAIELRDELDKGNLSQQEAHDKRLELLKIQDEIIKKYGLEAKGVSLLSDSVDVLSSRLDALAAKSSKDYLREHKGAINEAYENLYSDRYVDAKVLNYDTFGTRVSFDKNVRDIYEKAGGTLRGMSGDFKGTPEEILNFYERIYDSIEKSQSFSKELQDDLLSDVGRYITSWKTLIEENSKVFDDGVSATAKSKYYEQYNEILKAQNEFNEAMASGDKKRIGDSIVALEDFVKESINASSSDEYAQGLAKYFTSFLDVAEYEIKKRDFTNSLLENFGFGDKGGHVFDLAKKELIGLMADGDISQFSDKQQSAFNRLSAQAEKAGLSVGDLEDVLVDLGIMTRNTTTQTEKKTVSLEELFEATKSIVSETNKLNSAFAEQEENGKLSSNTILDLIESGYAAILTFDEETQSIYLNAEAYKKLTKAKIEAQIAELKLQQTSAIVARQRGAALTNSELQMVESTTAQIAALQQILGGLDDITKGLYTQKSSKSSGNPWDNELKAIEHSYAMAEISTKTYYDKLLKLKRKYNITATDYIEKLFGVEKNIFSDTIDVFDDMAESAEDDLQRQIKIYQQAQNAILNQIKTAKAAGKAAESKYIKDLESLYKGYADKIKGINDKIAEDRKKKLEEMLDDTLSAYKDRESDFSSTLSAVTNVIDEQIKALEDKKKAIEDANKAQDEANELLELQNDLTKAQIDLQNAMKQKNIRILKQDGTWEWVVDQKAVQDAKDDVKNAEKALKDYNVQQQINEIDKQIADYQDYKDQWTSIADTYENEQNRLIASQMLGANWEQIILNNRLTALKKFSTKYNSLMNGITSLEGKQDTGNYNNIIPLDNNKYSNILKGVPVGNALNNVSGIKAPFYSPNLVKNNTSISNSDRNYIINIDRVEYKGANATGFIDSLIQISKVHNSK